MEWKHNSEKLTWDEAKTLETNGWRLPTEKELWDLKKTAFKGLVVWSADVSPLKNPDGYKPIAIGFYFTTKTAVRYFNNKRIKPSNEAPPRYKNEKLHVLLCKGEKI
jgi:hypothetical protein